MLSDLGISINVGWLETDPRWERLCLMASALIKAENNCFTRQRIRDAVKLSASRIIEGFESFLSCEAYILRVATPISSCGQTTKKRAVVCNE